METVLKNPLKPSSQDVVFSVLRVPFFLEPGYSESKPFIESNRERLVKKWGGVQGWERQKQAHNLKGRGLEAGIPHFNLDRLTGNTMASHRLIQYIGKKYGLAVSEALYDKLNVYYFVDGHSLNDRERLAAVSSSLLTELLGNDDSHQEDIFISKDSILKFLNGSSGRKEIQMALSRLDDLGVHGIPKFIIEGSTVVDGAAHSRVFIDIFRQIEKRGHVEQGPVFADILGVSDEVVDIGSHDADRLLAST